VVVWDGSNWVRQYYRGGDILNLVRDSTGRIWGNGGSALFLFGMDTFQRYDYQNSPINSFVTGVCADTGRFVWVTTAWGGLFHTDGVQFDSITPRNSGMPGEGGCESPVRGADGRVWMGLGLGFAIFDPRDSSWVAYDTSNSPIPFTANQFLTLTSDGVLWFSSQSGVGGALVKFDGSNWTLYTTQNSPLPHWQIWAVAVGPDDRVWVHCASEGVVVIDDDPVAVEERASPDASRITPEAWPNPFRHTTTISFGAPRARIERVAIVDAAGRLVRTLAVESGASSLVWDGRDQAGRRVAPGAYFARSGTTTARLVMLD
ncbi:hypothetical protein FJY69_01220, partial [candidate division WOR-3 bacterium]|nr:hypothetical protein [candidate division WOR-3 bacterium]